jgi:hypothetical protein
MMFEKSQPDPIQSDPIQPSRSTHTHTLTSDHGPVIFSSKYVRLEGQIKNAKHHRNLPEAGAFSQKETLINPALRLWTDRVLERERKSERKQWMR